MKSYVILLALLQTLGCSGLPRYNSQLESMANKGLRASVAEVSSTYAGNHLYRATRGSVTRVIPVGPNAADLLMVFAVKETQCLKTSRRDPQTCAFRPGFYVPSFSCTSRVQVSATSTQVLNLRCGRDSSSSSEESSEEMIFRGRMHFNIPFADTAVPAHSTPYPPPPPVQHSHSHHSHTEDIGPRGDTFTNYLV